MNIAYIEPLAKAWNRMKEALFRPFNLNKWLVVGFTAFLAGLGDGHRGTSSIRFKRDRYSSLEDIIDLPSRAWEWLIDHPFWLAIIVISVTVILAIVVFVLWLSSRGKFMFLDNVVHNQAEISKPWKQFKALGNSLFLWRLCFTLVCFMAFTVVVGWVFEGIISPSLHKTSYKMFSPDLP